MKIATECHRPPIPTTKFDWSAVDADTYDPDRENAGPVGWGSTEAEAIADLMEQIADDAEAPCPRCDEMRGCDRPEGCRDPACPTLPAA